MTLQTAQVGDILYTSWGYDQTNIDFYEIIERRGKSTIVLRKLKSASEQEGWCAHKVTPLKGEYSSDEQHIRRINKDGYAKLESYAYLHAWDGKPKHATSYA